MSDNRAYALIVTALWVVGAVVAVTIWFLVTADNRALSAAYDDAHARWEAHRPAAYAFDYSACGGMCMSCSYRITVRGGAVVDVARPTDVSDDDEQCDRAAVGPPWDQPTIDQVLAWAGGLRVGGDLASVEVVYDPDWGFPVRADATCDDDIMDCGYGASITQFEVLSAS